MGFFVQQLRIKVLANQLHHSLPQFLVSREIEDDVQACSSQDLWDTVLDGWFEGVVMLVSL